MTAVKNIHLAHERDAAWLIALYLAVHGGDPAPNEGTIVAHGLQEAAALNAIAALSAALDEKTQQAVQHAIAPLKEQREMHSVEAKVAEARLGALGIHIKEQTAAAAHGAVHAESLTERATRFYCVRFRGITYCTQLPSPDPIPFA